MEDYLDTDKTFAVDAVVFSEEFRHSKFVSYKVKDAIVDYFREKTGKRPGVRVNKPDVLLNIHIAETKCTLSLDSSGESLHRRGYRQEAVEAPLNEVLAAGMILMTGWRGECDLIDPMCGSGTIPIEAALIARNIAPGVFRKEFAFEKWVDFDQELFDTIYNDDSQEREFTHKDIRLRQQPEGKRNCHTQYKGCRRKQGRGIEAATFPAIRATCGEIHHHHHPPYGERISTNDLLGLYSMIGERLKHAFTGNTAWILSYREECFDQIGLKATSKIPLFNGALECEFRQYEIFDGKYKEFRAEGEELSKERKEFRPASGERKEFKPGERREFRPRFSGERREFGSERREFNGERRPREFKDGEKREFRPRERREFKDGERREFRPRERREFGGERRTRSGESYPESKRREAGKKEEE